jgi:hypothetical protein
MKHIILHGRYNIKKNWLFLFNITKDELYSQVNTTIIGASSLSGKNAGKYLILMQVFNIQNLYFT